jgi:hypothetical protein
MPLYAYVIDSGRSEKQITKGCNTPLLHTLLFHRVQLSSIRKRHDLSSVLRVYSTPCSRVLFPLQEDAFPAKYLSLTNDQFSVVLTRVYSCFGCFSCGRATPQVSQYRSPRRTLYRVLQKGLYNNVTVLRVLREGLQVMAVYSVYATLLL